MENKKKFMRLIVAGLMVVCLLFIGCSNEQKKAAKQAETEQQGEVTELASGGKTIKWSLFSAYGPEDGACCEMWPVLFERIKKATGGQLEISIYWSGQHPYEGSDMLKVIRDGEAQMVHFYSGYLTSVEPVFGIDSIPMLLPTDAMQSFGTMAKLWGNFEQDTDGVLEKILQERWNASMIHLMPASPQRFFTKGYEIDGIGSLKKHKIRVYSPELAQLVTILGGTPVSLSFGEVYTGLSTGLIDGLVTSLQFAKSGGFLEVCDTIDMWEIMAAMDGVIVGLKALNELPEDVRKVFLTIMRNSAKKPEMLELTNNAIILENELLSGLNAFVPDAVKREEVAKRVQEKIVVPWIEENGEDAKAAIKQIEEYKDSLQ